MADTNPSWQFLEDWSPGIESWRFTLEEVDCNDCQRQMDDMACCQSLYICFYLFCASPGDNMRVQNYSWTISVTENEPTVPKIQFL